MTDYAGESYLIVATSDDFDGEAITPTEIDDVTIEIFDKDLEVVVVETSMVWDAPSEQWRYQWDTAGYDPGTYRARVTVYGPGDTISWEFRRIRLARSPDAA